MEVFIWKLPCIDRWYLKSGDLPRSLRGWRSGRGGDGLEQGCRGGNGKKVELKPELVGVRG